MKLCARSFMSGILTAAVCVAAVGTVLAAGGIKTAEFNANKVVFDGEELDLSNSPMISVVKEGETNASNYMPLRGVLEQMGYTVGWDGETKTVSITTAADAGDKSQPGEGSDKTDQVNMPNPWQACAETEAFEYLGASFKIEPPTGYKLAEAATLSEAFAEESGKTARFAYTNAAGEMYRVHITEGAAKELSKQGEPVKANGTDAYYDKESSSVSYTQDEYLITIDMAGKSEEELIKQVGTVTIQK